MSDNKASNRVVVVSAGVAGLSCAYLIRKNCRKMGINLDLTILEAGDRHGGSTRTEMIDGYTCERGPNGFLDNEPATLELIDMLGLKDRLVPADESAGRRFIYHGGKMREIALHPLKFLKSDILPWSAKFRMGLEFFIPRYKGDGDETVLSFGRRRLGESFAKLLLDPMVSGIFAGNIDELSLKAVFPNMYSMEREYGGLFKALIGKKREAKKTGKKAGGPGGPGALLHTFKSGMGELTDSLAGQFESELKISSPVKRIEYSNGSFVVKTEHELFEADSVILACPSFEAATIVNDLDNVTAGKLNAIPFAPVDVVCHGHPKENIAHDVNGFGVLIPRSEGIRSLGCLWSDSIFPGQAPVNHHLLRTILGGAHDYAIAEESFSSINSIAHDDMDKLLGINKEPSFKKIFRHPKGIAQYIVGHLDKLSVIENLEKDLPGLFFTGASYRGVSVNGCVKDAFRVTDLYGNIVRQV
ncbi:MAG: protoporphyrinogen oxidase [candidate division Zixibacteria bacterium]